MNAQSILDGNIPGLDRRRSVLNPAGSAKKNFGPNDLFIAIMGVTGSGKSTFISRCVDVPVEIGHGLKSHTSDIAIYPMKYLDKTIHLIDTPGFDDTYRRDIDVLKDVSFWLNKSYKEENIQLTGIVYLHRITDVRVGGTARKDLLMFKKLCGEDSFSNIVLATTMWENVPDQDGNRRENELRTSTEFYGSMIRKNATMLRHHDHHQSAMNIITFLVNRGTTTVLNIQREMANQGLSLSETEAGRELDSEMIKQRELFETMLKDNQADLERALKEKDDSLAQRLAEQQEELNQKIDNAKKGRDELKIDMEKLFKEKDEQFQQAMEELSNERKERERVLEAKSQDLEQYKKAIQEAEEMYDKKRQMQEAETENYKLQLEQANGQKILVLEAALRALQEQDEENNRRMEENLAFAKAEQDRKAVELAKVHADAQAASQLRQQWPQYYTGSPPPYSPYSPYSPVSYPQYGSYQQQQPQSRRSGASTAMMLGGAAALAPALLACSIM